MAIRRLYVDIETSPMIAYTWRIGRKIDLSHDNILREPSIICICWKWEGKKVEGLTWDKDQSDKAMLAKFIKVLMQADEVIGHNGDRFDLPWIRTRCFYHGIRIPHQLPSVDTLKQARKGFNFPSNRLDYLGKYMGVGRKKETGGFGLWKGVMDKDAASLALMVDYCKQDVELLERVHQKLYAYTKPTTHIGVASGGYKHWCPSCGSSDVIRNGNKHVTNFGVTKVQMKCKGCGTTYRMNETQVMSEMLREHKAKQLAKGRV
jgi:hypothetical protein